MEKTQSAARPFKILIIREEQCRLYRKCQQLMRTLRNTGLPEIHVPQQDSEVASNSVLSWRTVTFTQEMIDHIINQNQKQFSQARDTPLADTPLGRRIGKYVGLSTPST